MSQISNPEVLQKTIDNFIAIENYLGREVEIGERRGGAIFGRAAVVGFPIRIYETKPCDQFYVLLHELRVKRKRRAR
jgi:hypothetical protein